MVSRLLDFREFIDKALPEAFSDPDPAAAKIHPIPESDASVIPMDTDVPQSAEPLVALPPVVPKKINRTFVHAATDAFQAGFRVRPNKPAEMIAKYIDRAMRRGQQDASNEEFEHVLDSALGLYRFTQGAYCSCLLNVETTLTSLSCTDKDVFRTFYTRALAKRLLLQRSASDDFEKAVLKKLKERESH